MKGMMPQGLPLPCMTTLDGGRSNWLKWMRIFKKARQSGQREPAQPPNADLEDSGVELRGAAEDDGVDSDSHDRGRASTGRASSRRVQAHAAGAAAGGAARRPLPKTSIARRANRFIMRLFDKGDTFLALHSKQAWEDEGAARAEQGGSGEVEEGEDPEEGGEGRDDGAAYSDADGNDASRREQPLVEPQIFMCALLANGRIRLACSAGFEGHDLTQKVREQFIAAAGIKRDSDRLEASFDQRAVRGATRSRQPGARGRSLTACVRNLAPSKVLRKLAREAFAKHVQPKLEGGVQLCKYGDRKACRIVRGADRCSAGGRCKEARRLLPFWPEGLACVNPLHHSMASEWHTEFLKALQGAGLPVSLPDQAAARR